MRTWPPGYVITRAAEAGHADPEQGGSHPTPAGLRMRFSPFGPHSCPRPAPLVSESSNSTIIQIPLWLRTPLFLFDQKGLCFCESDSELGLPLASKYICSVGVDCLLIELSEY